MLQTNAAQRKLNVKLLYCTFVIACVVKVKANYKQTMNSKIFQFLCCFSCYPYAKKGYTANLTQLCSHAISMLTI